MVLYNPIALLSLLSLLSIGEHSLVNSSTHDGGYPPGSLPCKTLKTTLLDCSHRELTSIPILARSTTQQLFLNNNKLTNLTGKPFANISSTLSQLILSYNGIHRIEAGVFSALSTLRNLDLSSNHLVVVPDDIFHDLSNLRFLNFDHNYLQNIPSQALAPIKALEIVTFFDNDFMAIDFGPGFRNLTNLQSIVINRHSSTPVRLNITSNLFQNLWARSLLWLHFTMYVSSPLAEGIFTNLTNLNTLIVGSLFLFQELQSLNSPLEVLNFYPGILSTISDQTLRPLAQWNATLTSFTLTPPYLERIEGAAFAWLPLLRSLDISYHNIYFLSENAFEGLIHLESLNLSNNNLATFNCSSWSHQSLKELDLSFNKLTLSTPFFQSFIPFADTLNYLNLQEMTILQLDTSVFLPFKHLTEMSTQVLVVNENSPSLPSLKILHLRSLAYEKQYVDRYGTTICKFAPNLEQARLSNFKLEKVSDVVGTSCVKLVFLDISGCLKAALKVKQPNVSLPNLRLLYATMNKLTSVTQIMFFQSPLLILLDLSFNNIFNIEDELLPRLQNLQYLNMLGNKLTSVGGIRTLQFLNYLNLAENQITHVPRDLHMNVSASHDFILFTQVYLDLSGNPFDCTCAIQSFRKWIANDTIVHLVPNKMYTCATPSSEKGLSITEAELDCRSYLAFYLSLSIPCGIIVVVVVILTVRYCWHIRYKLFLMYHRGNWQRIDNDEEADVNDMTTRSNQYDAYVVYNEDSVQDEAWVINRLRANMEEGEVCMKLCIKGRDFLPGSDLLDTICESIQQSRKTILVLTPRFVADEWCHFEMRMANMRLFQENRDVLILVLLEEIPDKLLTMSLRQMLCEKELLKWPGDGVGQDLFWRRLRAEIQRPAYIDRRFV